MDNDTLNAHENLLREILLRRGFVSAEQLAECDRALQVITQHGLKRSLLRILVDKGFLTREQIREIRREMVAAGVRPVIGGYEVIEKLGEGGMGSVYKARQLSLNRIVALKVLSIRLSSSEEFVKRFEREARLAGKLNHPNTVLVYNVGKDGERYYIAMEYVDGTSVGHVLRKGKRYDERVAARIMLEVCRALAEAHKLGIVHRDIKPSNILITSDGRVKLSDLGVAKQMHADDISLTRPGMTVGTPAYMSPEQAMGSREVDARSDIYSMGATLYHMLTGAPPFEGETSFEIMEMHVTQPIPNPKLKRPELSDAICNVMMRMLAKSPTDRYQSCEELIAELEKVLRGHEEVGAVRERLVSICPATSGRRAAMALLLVMGLIGAGLLMWKPFSKKSLERGPESPPSHSRADPTSATLPTVQPSSAQAPSPSAPSQNLPEIEAVQPLPETSARSADQIEAPPPIVHRAESESSLSSTESGRPHPPSIQVTIPQSLRPHLETFLMEKRPFPILAVCLAIADKMEGKLTEELTSYIEGARRMVAERETSSPQDENDFDILHLKDGRTLYGKVLASTEEKVTVSILENGRPIAMHLPLGEIVKSEKGPMPEDLFAKEQSRKAFRAVITACKSEEWPRALELIGEMRYKWANAELCSDPAAQERFLQESKLSLPPEAGTTLAEITAWAFGWSITRCDVCRGKCKVTCARCNGSGVEVCPQCGGKRWFSCNDCNGNGRNRCPRFDCLHGTIRCPTCLGRGTVDISLPKPGSTQQQTQPATCFTCRGRGRVDCPSCEGGWIRCGTCRGTGRVTCNWCGGKGYARACPACEGNKQVKCEACDGTGRKPDVERPLLWIISSNAVNPAMPRKSQAK